jgi:hypothetical protein
MSKPFDYIIFGFALSVTVALAWDVYGNGGKAEQVRISGASGEWVYPLQSETELVLPGPLGDTVVRISNGQAWVESSPCLNQTCIQSGHISRPGAFVACLPNEVLLTIEGGAETNDVDASVR